MKKFSTLAKMALALLLGGTALSANAQNVIEEGVTFKPAAGTVYEFTPTIDGTLTIDLKAAAYYMFMRNWDHLLYSNAAATSGIDNNGFDEIDGCQYYYNNLKAGTKYYFKTDYYANVDCTFTMKIYAGESIAKVTPSTVNLFNYVMMQDILLYGNNSITGVGNFSFTYGDTTVPLDNEKYIVGLNGGGDEGYFIQVTGVALQQLIAQAANSGAQSFTITVDNVKTANGPVVVNDSNMEGVTVNDGTVSVTYDIAPAAQYLPEKSTWPQTFYSSWQSGDPAGMATLAFDQEIQRVGNVTVMMGYFEQGMITEMDSYEIPATPNGSNIVLDFTGVPRAGNVKQVTVIVENVVGKNGLNANLGETPLNLSSTLFQYINYSSQAAPENPDIPENPGADYMSGTATLDTEEFLASDLYAAVELTWPETVSIVDAETLSIPVSLNGTLVGNLSSTYVQLWPAGENAPETRVETGDKGTLMILLIATADLVKGPGEYTIEIPEGIVENAAGEINKAQTLTVECIGGVQAEVTPAAGAEFEVGEEVVITFSFDGVVEQNYSEDAPVNVTNYGEYDENITWAEGVLYIDGNDVVLNLGKELEPGMYYVTLREAQVVVDGEPNEAVSDYTFSVVEGETGAIDSIGADSNTKVIYNLNGVKVNENNLKAGVYIINGKKVIVK